MKTIIIALSIFFVLTLCSVESNAQTRISFARGRTSTSVSGTIGGGGSRSYVLGARYGQFLSANISSRGDCVTFSNRATNTSYVTKAGNNYLYVRNSCGRAVSFTMTVSINYGSD